MDHHHKRKSDDDSLCTESPKRARLSMVPDSAAPSRLPSPSATNESTTNILKYSREGSAASPPQQNYYHLPPLHKNALTSTTSVTVSMHNVPTVSSSPPSDAPMQEQIPAKIDVFPPINREMLKELDLDVVLRHPQLRHDFLFDSGLQFRTMMGGRRQHIADQYWGTVLRELEHALDTSKHKRTRPPTPPPWSEKHYSAYLHAATDPQVPDSRISSDTSSPSLVRRVPALLHTLTEVLTYVVGSVSSERNLTLSQVLSNIDTLFIDHQLRQGLYEPKGLFILMGQLLKAHCAPMRDGKVDVMVAVAKGDLNPSGLFGPQFSTSEFLPFTDGQRSIRRTVASLRLCFEILELMKLDIANHHLHHLRPYLITSGPDFLHRVFVDKVRRGLTSLDNTRRFLNDAYANIMSHTRNDGELPGSTCQAMLSNILDSSIRKDGDDNLTRTLGGYPHGFRIHLALIASLTDMIFNPPTFDSYVCQCGFVLPMRDLRSRNAKLSNQQQQHVHEFRRHRSAGANQPSWPETLWLDSNRIAQLIGDAADLTALYVLLMGWRMLVFAKQDNNNSNSNANGSSSSSSSSSAASGSVNPQAEQPDDDRKAIPPYVRSISKLEDWEIDRIKKEIWSIAPRKFGNCFFWDDYSYLDTTTNTANPSDVKRPDTLNNDQSRLVWKDGMENVALQIAMRAEDTRRDPKDLCEGEERKDHSGSASVLRPRMTDPTRMPTQESLSLLRSWLDTHMRRSSSLTTRLRKLLATEVATTAAKMTLHMVSAGLPLTHSSNGDQERSQFTTQTPLGGLSNSTPTSALYNTSLSPEIRRGSIPSLLSPQTPTPNRRIPPLIHCIPPHRPINIIPSPAAVSAGLEPLMPEIKHLASRIAKLTYINMKTFWSLYTAPGFLDLGQETTAPISTPLTPESTPQR